ncbi:MAG: hypothetical protein JW738_10305, partial [Actinobacteria bacterium]|nr:hypothetical protein [Actinomycetota bacterium]
MVRRLSGKNKSYFGIAVAAMVVFLMVLPSIALAGTRWTANGVVICSQGNDQSMPEIASDGSGG